jgi:hypothetical protein
MQISIHPLALANLTVALQFVLPGLESEINDN